jgi:hypothetical protein
VNNGMMFEKRRPSLGTKCADFFRHSTLPLLSTPVVLPQSTLYKRAAKEAKPSKINLFIAMSRQPEETTTAMDTSKTSNDDARTATGTTSVKEKKEKEKKPGFFARWKESTSKAYDAHRAAGGNL